MNVKLNAILSLELGLFQGEGFCQIQAHRAHAAQAAPPTDRYASLEAAFTAAIVPELPSGLPDARMAISTSIADILAAQVPTEHGLGLGSGLGLRCSLALSGFPGVGQQSAGRRTTNHFALAVRELPTFTGFKLCPKRSRTG
jgi:hypothetical protein